MRLSVIFILTNLAFYFANLSLADSNVSDIDNTTGLIKTKGVEIPNNKKAIQKFRNPLNRDYLKLGFGMSNYEYNEPSIMKLKGKQVGISTESRIAISRMAFIGNFDYNNSSLDYTSAQTGSMNSIPNNYYEISLKTGPIIYNKRKRQWANFIPYFGLGYRYLNSDASNKKTTTGHYGYKRESTYYYMPLGIYGNFNIMDLFTLSLNYEYRFLDYGEQVSHFQNGSGGISEVTVKQNGGHGRVLSILGSRKIYKNLAIFGEYYQKNWRIKKSNKAQITLISSGSPVLTTGYEPRNNTEEMGFKLGAIMSFDLISSNIWLE